MKQQAHILAVDDQPDNLLILEDILKDDYVVHTVPSGEMAIDYLALGHLADLILLDVVMPGMDGFEVCRRLRAMPGKTDVPVLFLTSLQGAEEEAAALALGADDFIHKPLSPPVVLARVRNHLHLAAARMAMRLRNEDLEAAVEARTRELFSQSAELIRQKQAVIAAQGATITAFCTLAEARDNETGNHIRRTQNYVRALAEQLREHPSYRGDLDDETLQLLYRCAPLHDIGKVAIPDAILNKPGKLTAEEWVIMKRHPEFGRDAIVQVESGFGASGASFLRYAREIAHGHHERWDGSGYPQGISGTAIPLSARLMAVADVYDALISRRPYKAPFSHAEAISLIAEGRGRHFDPAMVDAFFAIETEFRDIALRFADGEELKGATSEELKG